MNGKDLAGRHLLSLVRHMHFGRLMNSVQSKANTVSLQLSWHGIQCLVQLELEH